MAVAPQQTQIRRGSTAEHSSFTGAVGELTVDTDKKLVVVHDGATAGGLEMVDLDASQILTNKTLTTPIISTISNTGSLTLPTSTDTLVGKATTDALTNKTLNADGTGNVITNIGSSEIKSEMITGTTAGTVATGDSFIFSDVNDSGNLKSDTIQGILDLGGSGDALTSNPLSQFAATTSAQLLGVMSDETGTGLLVFGTSPTIVTPTIASMANANHDHIDAAGGGVLSLIPQVSVSAAKTFALTDAGKNQLHPSADTTARIWTIDANATVAFPVDTVLMFTNQDSAGVLTISIATDTMRLAGAGTTGSRTLAANGVAFAIKLTSTEWLIDGTGLT